MVRPDLTAPQLELLHEAGRLGRVPVRPVAFPPKKLVEKKLATFVKRPGGGYDLVLTAAGRERELYERKRAEAREAEVRLKASAEPSRRHVGMPKHVKEAMARREAARLKR